MSSSFRFIRQLGLDRHPNVAASLSVLLVSLGSATAYGDRTQHNQTEEAPTTKQKAAASMCPDRRRFPQSSSILTSTQTFAFAPFHRTTHCEEQSTSPPRSPPTNAPNDATDDDPVVDYSRPNDSFPNLTRHGDSSLLRQYLTPDVYHRLHTLTTAQGVTLDDLIRAGVCLPHGAHPPHGVAGVYAGDADSYTVFADLLNPILERHHKAVTRVRLQRFRTNLNPEGLLQRRLDPRGEYILYTRMRLARSIAGFRFAPTIQREERRCIERLFQDCVSDWSTTSTHGSTNDGGANSSRGGSYKSVMSMTNKEHDDLVRRQLLFADPDDYIISAGLARDWPDARGIYCDSWKDTPNLMIWCNAQDHIWIISNAKGGDVQGVFSRMSKAAWALETSLKQRGYRFIEDRRLGFLNTSPADIGPAMRASVCIKLVRLGQHKGFSDLMKRLRLEARVEHSQSDKRYTGIFDIGNAEALGKTEVQLINVMIQGVAVCIELERRLENGEKLKLEDIEVEIMK